MGSRQALSGRGSGAAAAADGRSSASASLDGARPTDSCRSRRLLFLLPRSRRQEGEGQLRREVGVATSRC
jgi:hypothetical protein